MTRPAIQAEKRTEAGKGQARRLRRMGKVPGIVYGSGVGELKVQVDANPLQKLLASAGTAGLIDLNVDSDNHVVLVRDVQRDPVQGQILHVDFHAVSLDQQVQTQVPVVIVGEDARPSDGGTVAPAMWEVTVACLPTEIPERIEVDVSGLAVGESLTVGDLQAPPGVTIISPAEEIVVSITPPRRSADVAREEAEAADAADAGEAAAQEASEGGEEA